MGEYAPVCPSEAPSSAEQFIAPMRQAQSVLGQVSELARTLADDSLFSSLMTQLSALPSAASFNPLQASKNLPVDIPPLQQEAPQENENRRQFIDALQQKARDKSAADANKRSVNTNSSANGVASTSPLEQTHTGNVSAMPAQGRRVSSTTPSQGGEQQVRAAGNAERDTVRATIGSWAALERIAELVQQLESKPVSGPSVFQEAPGPKGAPLPLASARAPRPAPGSGPQQEQRVQTSETMSGAKSAGGKGEGGSELPTLQRLVDDAWAPGSPVQPTGGVNKGQMQSDLPSRTGNGASGAVEQALYSNVPAPRGASMLNPQLAGGSNKSTHGTAASTQMAMPTAPTNDGNRSGFSPQSVPVIHEDELAERLNRALIEQAWRGGVDLT